jgi:predicted TIM-barrel fold metal-dependent hydrolase
MRDAACDKYSQTIGEYVPIEDWEVTVSESVTQEQDPKGFFYTVYSGTLTWTSASSPLERVQEEINWRIGDRMCMYEIDYDNWHVYIHPKKVATVPVA